VAGNGQLMSKQGFKMVLVLTEFEQTGEGAGERGECETMKQVGAGK